MHQPAWQLSRLTVSTNIASFCGLYLPSRLCSVWHRAWQLLPLSLPLLTWLPLLPAGVTLQDLVCGTPPTTSVAVSALLAAPLTPTADSVQAMLAWLPCSLLHCLVNMTTPSSWAAAVFIVVSPREFSCLCSSLLLLSWSMHILSDGRPPGATSTVAVCPVLQAVLLSGAATSSQHLILR